MLSHNERFIFTSESVSEGHPDKVCDQISDAILDYALSKDSTAHVACETLATTNFVTLSGEVTPALQKDECCRIVKEVVRAIGYDRKGEGFNCDDLQIEFRLHGQSADIARGVGDDTSLTGEQGAGDQGIMFGYACDETPQLMPAPLYYSRLIMKRLAELRKSDPAKYGFLRPDAKAQLSFSYENGTPVAVTQAVVSHQHTDGSRDQVYQVVKQVLKEVIPAEYLKGIDFTDGNENKAQSHLYINPTGNFVIGGPDGDTGVTGRKIIVDTYGGMGRHGGGAFSGKDPSKVDRSACYMARYVAKNLVSAGAARRCELQVAYAIGMPHPLSFYVNFFGTGKVSEERVEAMLNEEKVFNFRPAKISEYFGLKNPQGWSYRDSAAYGPFGHDQFPWEKLDRVEELRKELGL